MDWAPRVGTRAAAHLPTDAEDLCERAFFRLAYCMKWENIPPKLGIYLLPSASKTFAQRGERQVSVVAKEEKRAFTLCDFLPFQCVWAGKTAASLPSDNAPGMAEAPASEKSPRSHFSTLKTMIEYVKERVIDEDPHLDNDQKAIFYIDIYPVHTGEPFRQFFITFEDFILAFVPGNCTGKPSAAYQAHSKGGALSVDGK
ncbi:hypothetical protein F5876DRAFT_87306 [Lentinula aff. lateritia]|uniref:Uncharacterized protein n=1 Tax=Lentinula aff. lateritia TaxID=2804960 RepID=A0ACC1U8A2_9AGAR|nr:hypothetical protein F5876DRAFT_87306 [Lentinula aff. lateritia]